MPLGLLCPILRDAAGPGYTDFLENSEFDTLSLFFQLRHVPVQLDGIADQQYVDRSNDHRFDVGQSLVVTESSVSDAATVIDKPAAGLIRLTWHSNATTGALRLRFPRPSLSLRTVAVVLADRQLAEVGQTSASNSALQLA